MIVKWSACLPSTLTIRVRILLTLTVFSVKLVFEKNENKQREAGLPIFLKKVQTFQKKHFSKTRP